MERLNGAPPKEEAGSLAVGVVARLEQEILNGIRKPGDRLDERQLAEQFNISRTPVREALQRLAASGLVVSRGRQGLQVSQLSLADLLDAFSVVAELEALACQQAARRMQPEQRARMQVAQDACAKAAAAEDVEAFYAANLVFHEAIALASHNSILQEELRRLTLKVSPYRRTTTYQPGRMHASIPEHENVMNAIIRGDGPAAAQLMRAHVTLLGEGLSDLLHFLRTSGSGSLIKDMG